MRLVRNKLKKAENTSYVQSINECVELIMKKIVKPIKFISSDDEEDDSQF